MTYTTQNGVRYPDLMLEKPEAAPGKYGLLRLRYLEKSDPGQLNSLLLEGALNSHLAQIDRQVRGQVEQTMERLVQRTRLPDKQTDPLGWAGTCLLYTSCDRIIYAMCGCHGNLYAVMKEIMRRREGLELGGVRPPLPGLAAGDSPKVDQCARMIDEAIETYCK